MKRRSLSIAIPFAISVVGFAAHTSYINRFIEKELQKLQQVCLDKHQSTQFLHNGHIENVRKLKTYRVYPWLKIPIQQTIQNANYRCIALYHDRLNKINAKIIKREQKKQKTKWHKRMLACRKQNQSQNSCIAKERAKYQQLMQRLRTYTLKLPSRALRDLGTNKERLRFCMRWGVFLTHWNDFDHPKHGYAQRCAMLLFISDPHEKMDALNH